MLGAGSGLLTRVNSDSVELDPDRLNNLLTDVGLSAHEGGKVFRRFAGCGLHSGSGELVAHGFAAKHRNDLIVQSIHDRRRRLRWRDDTLPDAEESTNAANYSRAAFCSAASR
jgi:hypothetical protein